MFGASTVLYAMAGLIGFIAVLRDLYLRPRYDLFHWLGVGVLMGTFAVPPLAREISRFMF